MTTIELKSFRSLNSSIRWLGIAASSFCALVASLLQQQGRLPTVKDLFTQLNVLKGLKQRFTCVTYTRPDKAKDCRPSLLVFVDASRTTDHEELGYVAGLLLGYLEEGTEFHSCMGFT